MVRQIVGVLARRIVCRVREGQTLERGERIGLMKFGSRMDVFLPPRRRAAASRSASTSSRRRDRARATDPAADGRRAERPLGAARGDRPRRLRRGVFLLPSLFTVANLFCGYACVVYATRGDFDTAAPFIGIAMVLDTLDGCLARLTSTSTAFGVELDSLADVVSFGLAPAILAFPWGLWPLGRLGWAAGFIFVTAAAMRLARFNIQTATAATSATSSACRARRRPASSPRPSSSIPWGCRTAACALLALPMVLVPALLMVSTIRFRSIKAIDVGWRRSYRAASDRRRRHRADRLAPADRARRDGLHLRRLGLSVDVGIAGSPRPPSASRVATLTAGSGPTAIAGHGPRGGPDRTRRRSPSTERCASGRLGPSGGRDAIGSAIVTVVPTPFSLSTSTVPPLISMLRRAIGRPRPVPVALVEK